MAGTYQAGGRKKADILKGSTKLFYKKGYNNTTYSDISEYLNINRALIPYHFNSKHSLAVSVYNDIINTAFNTADKLLDISELSSDLAAAFHIVIYYRFFENNKLRTFITDLLNESSEELIDIDYESTIIKDIDDYFSNIDEKELELICNCSSAMRYQLVRCSNDKKYDCDSISGQYINFLLRYAGTPQDTIDELINAALQLADLISCNVKTDYQISINYK